MKKFQQPLRTLLRQPRVMIKTQTTKSIYKSIWRFAILMLTKQQFWALMRIKMSLRKIQSKNKERQLTALRMTILLASRSRGHIQTRRKMTANLSQKRKRLKSATFYRKYHFQLVKKSLRMKQQMKRKLTKISKLLRYKQIVLSIRSSCRSHP